MSKAVLNLALAQKQAMKSRPKVGGFPYLAEVLRSAGVKRNLWFLPSCQSIYLTDYGPVVQQGEPLFIDAVDVPPFRSEGLVAALRRDQAGEGTFLDFLEAAWQAGVVRYEVDFQQRRVTYYGAQGEAYAEDYPAVALP